MDLQSTVSIAKIGTNSLRATIPEGIVSFLDVMAGDKLDWKMDVQNGKKIVVVQKTSAVDKNATRLSTKYVRPDKRSKK